MASKAELEEQLAQLQAQLAEKDNLIAEQGVALQNAAQAGGDPAEANKALQESLRAQEELKAQLAAQTEQLKRLGVGEGVEREVRVKMAAGLSREDAVVCARRQAAHDEVLKKSFRPLEDGTSADTQRQRELVNAAALP